MALVLLLVVGGQLVVLDGDGTTLEIGAASADLGVGTGRGDGAGLGVHLVDLLEGEETGLINEKVGEDDTTSAGTGPDEEDLGTKTSVAGTRLNEVRGGKADSKVPEPVGGSAQRESLGTDGEREDLTADDPGSRTPGGGEASNVDADEGDERLAGGGVGRWNGGTDNGDDELTGAHPDGTPDEELAATEALHAPHAWESTNDVDDVVDDREDEGVGVGKSVLGEGGTEVEDEVDTGKLLEGLDESTGESSKEVLSIVVLEAVEVRASGVGELDVKVGLDDRELGADEGVVNVSGVQAGKRLGGTLVVALLDEPTGGFGEDKEESAKDESKNKLDTDGDTPCAGVVAVLSTVRSKRGAKETDGDSPLVTGNNCTTDPARSSLGLVHGDNSGENTDTETSNDTATDENTEISSGHLHDDTNAEDDESNLHTPSSTKDVGNGSTGKGTDEGTSGKDRDNE